MMTRSFIALLLVVDDRDRIDLDQVARGHRRYPDHYVCWFVISELRATQVEKTGLLPSGAANSYQNGPVDDY
jgi:hypothetical protein